MISSPYYVHAISPVHVGSGDADAGAEQTVMRNPVTGYPLIPGSGIKGALRALARSRQLPEGALFGMGSDDGTGHAGSVGFHDANILLLPVRSAAGTFAWVTSPYALRLHARDLSLFCGQTPPPVPNVAFGEVRTSNECNVSHEEGSVILDDIRLQSQKDPAALGPWIACLRSAVGSGGTDLALSTRLCVVSDEVMSFLCRYSLAIDARNALGDNKAVKNFWHEENLPTESLLAGILTIDPPPAAQTSVAQLLAALKTLTDGVVQFGGNATTGRGSCRVQLA